MLRGLDEEEVKEAVKKNALEKVRISLERETRESSKVFYEVEGGRKAKGVWKFRMRDVWLLDEDIARMDLGRTSKRVLNISFRGGRRYHRVGNKTYGSSFDIRLIIVHRRTRNKLGLN